MPVIFQKIIKREDARRNPYLLYAFGDNVARKGYGGQAAELRGEPNAVGIRTKYTPGEMYFVEAPLETEAQKKMIDQDMRRLFKHVQQGGIVVWPADGVGTNRARMAITAPTTFEYLQTKLEALILASRAQQAAHGQD
ncbi:hypothetical protein HOU02_gp485 [Caulobacter phage CcrBL9]|uniref:DUF7831 domain-containing protein n=2 Tax=Bertelyvirus TaxID=2733152 RepID=A0A385ED33_9CAUD|nr:hypothetical protein HOU02_gp485 [Caulobacter phage CcrBL9]YP_009810424.1 hypothetical protein HOU03_gp473 [Caulobacter phage CcrSC]AXQ69240.1 hypothetical protein CcrBL9_gp216c [Caulobacter phage CcrBL9]AXQ69794.1 hypothetical protein CcrSC_gp212c [Caulobacter phage CcrSC]